MVWPCHTAMHSHKMWTQKGCQVYRRIAPIMWHWTWSPKVRLKEETDEPKIKIFLNLVKNPFLFIGIFAESTLKRHHPPAQSSVTLMAINCTGNLPNIFCPKSCRIKTVVVFKKNVKQVLHPTSQFADIPATQMPVQASVVPVNWLLWQSTSSTASF